MDRDQAQQMIEIEVNKMIDALMPNGGGAVLTETRLRYAFEKISQKAFEAGRSYALLSLMDSKTTALKLGVSLRRMQAIAKNRHERFGVGMQVSGKNPWLFTPEEIEVLRPGKPGKRVKKESEKKCIS